MVVKPRILRGALADAGLLALGLIAAFPLLWLVCASLKDAKDLSAYLLLPWNDLGRISGHGWRAAFSGDMLTWMVNSIALSGLITAGTVLVCSFAGYALARWPGRRSRLVIGFLAGTMMLPPQVLLPASYELMYHLGWLGTWTAIVLPSLAGAFSIILMRNAFAAVPGELYEAAAMDGAGHLRVFWQVAMPCVRPMASALTLMAFTAAWNAFLWPQVILADVQSMPLAVGIAGMGSVQQEDYAPMMAGTVLAIIPPLALFAWLQREFIAGLTQGAVKG